jgi:hypothetical protein
VGWEVVEVGSAKKIGLRLNHGVRVTCCAAVVQLTIATVPLVESIELSSACAARSDAGHTCAARPVLKLLEDDLRLEGEYLLWLEVVNSGIVKAPSGRASCVGARLRIAGHPIPLVGPTHAHLTTGDGAAAATSCLRGWSWGWEECSRSSQLLLLLSSHDNALFTNAVGMLLTLLGKLTNAAPRGGRPARGFRHVAHAAHELHTLTADGTSAPRARVHRRRCCGGGEGGCSETSHEIRLITHFCDQLRAVSELSYGRGAIAAVVGCRCKRVPHQAASVGRRDVACQASTRFKRGCGGSPSA